MAEDKKYLEDVEYVYTTQEMKDLGQKLALENQAVYDLEKSKKETDAAMTTLIKAANSRAAALTTKINMGHEIQSIEVAYLMNTPTPGMKTILRADTNDPFKTVEMTPAEITAEMQHRMFD